MGDSGLAAHSERRNRAGGALGCRAGCTGQPQPDLPVQVFQMTTSFSFSLSAPCQPRLGCKGDMLRVGAWGMRLPRPRPAPVTASTPLLAQGSTRRQHQAAHPARGTASSRAKQAWQGMDCAGERHHSLTTATSKQGLPSTPPKNRRLLQSQAQLLSCTEQRGAEATQPSWLSGPGGC